MSIGLVLLGLIFAGLLVAMGLRASPKLRTLAFAGAIAVFLLFLLIASSAYVPSDKVGIVTKHWLGKSLRDGKIISVSGEMGVQADVLPPGLHFGYWPFVYTVSNEPLVMIPSDKVGLIETTDGDPMSEGQLFAPEWKTEDVPKMLDATHFLTVGKGRKGKQITPLTPGTYRLNPRLFKVTMVEQTNILQGEVGVIKANFGAPATDFVDVTNVKQISADEASKMPVEQVLQFAKPGEMGIRRSVLDPGKYPINTDAFTVVEVWTTQMIGQFTAGRASIAGSTQTGRGKADEAAQQQQLGARSQQHDPVLEEREITVRTADGFTFPVDVRVEYVVEPVFAPVVVAKLGDDEGDRFRNALNSAVRAIFRNNAEKVRALDYVQLRSTQESQSLEMLRLQMQRFGVRITAVRIGNVGDEQTLGALLKTQTDRELAKQEQVTFQEQQKAAEQKKQLARAQQESDEEKKLATASYSVKIATEEQKRKITEATAEAESTTIKAKAQAAAYEQIALQIGKSNAAMIELLKIVGEKNIQITPRIYITGGGGSGGGLHEGTNAALVGTILDQLVDKDDKPKDAPKK